MKTSNAAQTVNKAIQDMFTSLNCWPPLHKWLVRLYNHVTGSLGKRRVIRGWSKVGISGKTTLSPEDPVENIEVILV